MTTKPRLSRRDQDILIRHGVLEMPVVPPVNKLAPHIKARGGRWSVTVSPDGFASATVMLLGKSFDGAGDEESQALVAALCQALEATQPQQASYLPPEDINDEDDGTESDDWPSFDLAGPGAPLDDDFVVTRVAPNDPTPKQMADELRAAGLPIRWDGAMYRNTETGDAYDGASGDWVKREYAALHQPATTV